MPSPSLRGGRFARWIVALAFATTLPAPTAAQAAWQEIVGGPSPIVHSVTTEAVHPSLADVDGTLYVAWEQHDGATDSEVRVSKLDGAGTAWVDVGGALSHIATDNAFRPNIASIGGVPWVAWIEFDGTSQKVRVARLNGAGTGWTEVVGGANPINHDATQNAFDPCLADVGGVPYVAWAEEPQPHVAESRIRVSRLNDAGTAWTEVVGGTNPINQDASAQAGGPSLTSIGGVPWVAWQEGYGDPKIHVSKLNDAGTAWTELGSGPAPINHDPDKYAASPSLTGIGGVPYVAWSEADEFSFQIRVARLDDAGTGWIEVVGGAQPINLPGGGAGENPSLTSIDGVPYVAFSQYDNNQEIRVKRLDDTGTSWIEVDGGPSPINESPDLDGVTPSLTVSDGVPVVAWSQAEEASPMQIRVSRDLPAVASRWDRAWGQSVDSGAPGTGFEVCTVAADCTAGSFGGDAPGAVNHPEGIATGPENYVYLTGVDDQDRGLISKYEPGGDFLFRWGGDGTTGGKFAGYPHGIAVDVDGHVYVADTSGNRIQEFTQSGAFIRTWGWGVNGGSGFEVCTVAASCTIDAVGHGEGGGFRAPYGIAADGAGNVYVAEDDNRRVQKFTVTDASVTFDRAWGADVATTGGTGAEVCTVAADCKGGIDGDGKGGETGRAVAIAVDPDGDVYVAEGTHDRIEEFTPDGAFVRAIGKGVDGGSAGEICTSAASCQPGQLGAGDREFAIGSEGAGLAFRPSGLLYVADGGNDRIQVLTAEGAFLRSFGAPPGQLGGQLAFPTAVAVGLDDPDILFVAAYDNRRVDKFVVGSGPVSSEVPDTVITSGPTSSIGAFVTFEFAAIPPEDATFECALDSVDFTPCTSPYDSPALDSGDHVFLVRASNAFGTDPTPASRFLVVDQSPPVAQLTLSGTTAASGAYLTGVVVDLDVTDAAPSSGIRNRFCVVDPPTPPTSFSAFGSEPCGGTVLASGDHVAYGIANDQAGNESAIVSRTFRILPLPDTTITSGPPPVSSSAPQFAFTSTPPGANFECRVDGGTFQGCTSPYVAYNLPLGTHTLSVRAVTLDGATDPTPATWAFELAERSVRSSCSFLVPFMPNDHDPALQCTVLQDVCPARSLCTAQQGVLAEDGDLRASIAGASSLRYPNKKPRYFLDIGCYSDPSIYLPGAAPCPFVGSEGLIGRGESISIVCDLAESSISYMPVQGSDLDRRITCEAVYTVRPVVSLDTTVTGSVLSVFASGPGTLVMSPGSGALTASVLAAGAAPKPPFRSVKKKLKKEGAVALRIGLSPALAKQLRTTGEVTVAVDLTFTPADGGAVQVRSEDVTLVKVKKARKAPRR